MEISVDRPKKDNRKSLTARVKPEDLVIVNQRLKLFGFNSINEMVHDFIRGKFPQITEERQIDNLIDNTQSNGLKSVLEGGINREFYERADLNDMYNYYLNIRKLHRNTCRDLISYFRRFRDQFFTDRVAELQSLTPRMRSRIMDVFRKFGQYYFYRYNNDQCTDLVSKIIRRHSLNVGSTDHAKLYIVDNNYLEERLKTLLEIQGEIGLIVKMGLYSGLRRKSLCTFTKGLCAQTSLHVIVINYMLWISQMVLLLF